jgi:2-amino-4-hydroxy-6-hydroxymethyldihydropteridine diphosphokinase
MKTAYLGLGSNLGDRLGRLVEALHELAVDPAISLLCGSSVYESTPVGVLEQPDFLNLVVQVKTAHLPLALLATCLAVEARLGRERRERWGPRTIDVDLLAYEQSQCSDDRLVLPHPRMHERGFVLTPLAEIAPEFQLNGESVRILAARIGTAGLRPILTWSELSALVHQRKRLANGS